MSLIEQKSSVQPADQNLMVRYKQVRQFSEKICFPLEIEDYVVQPRAEVSPPKWHLGHTTWFFETFLLSAFLSDYKIFHPSFAELFNSYYKTVGSHWNQGDRGQLSRPTVSEVMRYRQYVDEHMGALFKRGQGADVDVLGLVETGLQHEQQHQELLLMDIKSILAANPTLPAYTDEKMPDTVPGLGETKHFTEGVYEIGNNFGAGFIYDNEAPRHSQYVQEFTIESDFVSNGAFLKFIESDGYEQTQFWLSEGWDWKEAQHIKAPLYWFKQGGEWFEYSLYGAKPLNMDAPVCHMSYFEADAYARWAGKRLPTEAELEIDLANESTPKYVQNLHPNDCTQPINQLWSWTSTQYGAYPGFEALAGSLGEYNGKFMCNQFVLRGGCVATPPGHYRAGYRNFYKPGQRWMFSGIRLVPNKK